MPTPEQIDVLREEIGVDLDAVRELAEQLADARNLTGPSSSQKDLIHAGYLLHGVYTAWEGALRRIATVYENHLDPSQWHSQLLDRMTLDLPGIRPAVIDKLTAKRLHKLRSFRHFFRFSYGVQLDYEELALVLKAYDAVVPKLEHQLTEFLAYVGRIAEQAKDEEP